LLFLALVVVMATACVAQQATLQRAVMLGMLTAIAVFCAWPLLAAGEKSGAGRSDAGKPSGGLMSSGGASSAPPLDSVSLGCPKCAHPLAPGRDFLQENLASLEEGDLCVVCRECGAILELELRKGEISIARVVPRSELSTSMYCMGLIGIVGLTGIAIAVWACVEPMRKGADPMVEWMGRAGCVGVGFLAGILVIFGLAEFFSSRSLMKRRGPYVF